MAHGPSTEGGSVRPLPAPLIYPLLPHLQMGLACCVLPQSCLGAQRLRALEARGRKENLSDRLPPHTTPQVETTHVDRRGVGPGQP